MITVEELTAQPAAVPSLHDALRPMISVGSAVTARQMAVLARIATTPREECTGRGLADRLGISPAAICRAVDALTEIGWAERHPDPRDRRSVLILPTAAGREAIAPPLACVKETV